MKTIVALVDFSDLTPRILDQARTLAQAFQSHVILLHGLPKQPIVVDVGIVAPTIYGEPTAEDIEANRLKLDRLAEPLTTIGIKVTLLQLREATIEHIVGEARRLGADLIIVGSHHHSAFYNLIIGSVTNDILKSATCPVLVVPNN